MNFFSIFGPRISSEDINPEEETAVSTQINEAVRNILNSFTNTATGTTLVNPTSTTPPMTFSEISENTCLQVYTKNITEMIEEGKTDEEVKCAICHLSIDDHQIIRKINHCQHFFHQQCIDTWLTSNSTCPLCRHSIIPQTTFQPPRQDPPTNDQTYTIPISFQYF